VKTASFLTFIRRNAFVLIIFFIAIGYLAFLASSTQRGVFFSSDGGMKFMIVKQISQGHGFKYMWLPQPPFVHEIWNAGYFPLKDPFVYATPQGYLYSFPMAFQWINAFFYSRFGYGGLYILPALSAVLLWLFMIILLKYCHLSGNQVAIALFVMVFCSPLTVYGATYWEHLPAVLLLFFGIAFILKPPTGLWAAMPSGLICGAAVWLRPEALIMDMLYALAAILLYFKGKQSVYPAFLAGMFLSVAGFFLYNKMEYGSFFGVHGYQVLNEDGTGNKMLKGLNNLIEINIRSIHFFPFELLLIPVLFGLYRFKRVLDLRTRLLLWIVIAYCILAPFFLPNAGGRQWAARYFLPIVPIVVVVLLLIEKQWKYMQAGAYMKWFIAAMIACVGFSFYLNTYKGGIKKLRDENYYRIKPSLDFVTQQKGNVVVLGAGYIAMELGYLFQEKYFFLADSDSSLNRLLPLLKQQGIHEFVYIYDVNSPKSLPSLLKNTKISLPKKGDFSFSNYVIR